MGTKEEVVMENQVVGTQPEYLTAKELATKLNVSQKTVQKWRALGKLPIVKMGRLVRFPRQEIEKRLLTGCLLVDR